MKISKFFLLSLTLLLSPSSQAKKARTAYLSKNHIETIHLKNGHSTVLKFDHMPTPGVIGNKQDFLIETFQKVIAIKPQVNFGNTTLFVFTKEGIFNFKLVSRKKAPDILVNIKRKTTPEKIDFKSKLISKAYPLTLVVHKVLFPKSKNFVSIKFSLALESNSLKTYFVKKWKFYVTQSKALIPIKKIFVSRQSLSSKKNKLSGYLIINSNHLSKNKPIQLKLIKRKTKKTSISNPLLITIPLL